jgi:DNA-binding protein Fis
MVYDLCRQDMDEAAELLGIRSAALKKKLESYSLV